MLISFNTTGSYALWRNIIVCSLTGMFYAFSMGCTARLDICTMVIDAIVTVGLLFALQIVLWNIFDYAIPRLVNIYQSLLVPITLGLSAILIILGIESLVIYIFSASFDLFVISLPARIFCLAALYASYRLLYLLLSKSDPQQEEDESSEEPPTSVTDPIERITVKIGQKIKVILVSELIYLKAEDDYVQFVTADGHWLKNGTMKEYEAQLPSDKFVRVHRSYIVNIDRITKIERYGQKQSLQLSSGESLKISASGYKMLRLKLNL
jgi:hypothetical protein